MLKTYAYSIAPIDSYEKKLGKNKYTLVLKSLDQMIRVRKG